MMINPLVLGCMNALKPDPRQTVSEWADANRILTTEASAEAGKYRTSRVPFVREIQDSCSPMSPCSQVKVMKGTQLGLSTTGDNIMLTYLDLYPCPILYIVPTETLAKGTSTRRFTPAIRAIPHLRKKIIGGKGKDEIGNMFTKNVAGGGVTLGWSNSTSSFRSFSARLVILDDVDGFGEFGEGNVMTLGKARADAFSNKMIYINSTPTIEGNSNIEKEFEDSDQREYFMPCPECKELINFEWENFVFSHENYTLTSDVKYSCKHCGALIPEHKKTWMMNESNGAKWIPQNEGHIHRGYLVPSFLAPVGWLSWEEITREFLKASKVLQRGDSRMMQTWVNTRQARPFKPQLDGVDITNPDERTRHYGAEVPDEVMVLTAGVDTQDDRFEVLVLGHGHRGNLFVIDYKVIAGDPQYDATKKALDDYLINRVYTRVDGFKMKVMGSCVDTGGHRTKAVYEYVKHRLPNKIFGVKGASTINAPVVNRQLKDLSRHDSNLFIVGTTTIKDDFYARLSITEEGHNYVHFPKLDVIDDKFFKMLTAEKRNDKGQYVKIRTRNEAIDTMVYAIATLTILNIKVDELVTPILHIGEPIKKAPPPKPKEKAWLDEY